MKKAVRSMLTVSVLVLLIAAIRVPAWARTPTMQTSRQAALRERANVNRDISKIQPTLRQPTLSLAPNVQVQKTYQFDYAQGLLDFSSGHYTQASRNFRTADETLRNMPEWQHLEQHVE